MKLFATAAIVLMALAAGQSYAEQTTTPVRHNNRDAMIIPSEHTDSAMINRMSWAYRITTNAPLVLISPGPR